MKTPKHPTGKILQGESVMKKKLAILLVLASLTVAGARAAVAEEVSDTAAVAPQGQAAVNSPRWAARAQDPAMREKIQKFYKDTSGLRKQIFMKRAELAAVTNAAQADPATAGKMAGELYDLMASLKKQAEAAGINQFGPGWGCGMGGGLGRGAGMGGGPGRW